MLPYIFLILIILLFLSFDSNKFEKILFLPIALFVLIFVSIRGGGTGPKDYDAYIRLYQSITNPSDIVDSAIHAEIGFRILSYIGNYLSFEGQFIIILMAVLSLLPVFYIVYKFSIYKFTSILVLLPYLFTMNMHSSRISVAAGFCLLLYVAWYFRYRIVSMLFFIIAIAFHTSSIAVLAILLAKLKIRTLCTIGIAASIVCVFVNPLLLISDILLSFGAEKLSWMISSYTSSKDYGYPMPIYDPRILLNLFILFLVYNIRNRIIEPFHLYILKINLIGIIFLIVFSGVTIIAWRVSYLFLIIYVLSIPVLCYYYNSFFYVKYRLKRVANIVFYALFLLYIFPLAFMSLPYKVYF